MGAQHGSRSKKHGAHCDALGEIDTNGMMLAKRVYNRPYNQVLESGRFYRIGMRRSKMVLGKRRICAAD